MSTSSHSVTAILVGPTVRIPSRERADAAAARNAKARSKAQATQQPKATADVASKWKPLWVSTFFVGLALASMIAAQPSERPHGTPLPLVLVLAAFTAAWHWLLAVRRPNAHRKTAPMIGWAIVSAAATAMLVWMAPVYLFAASFLYAQIFQLMPSRSASVRAMGFTLLLFVPIESSLGHTFAMIMIGAAMAACLLAGFISAIVEQNRANGETIGDLRRAEKAVLSVGRRAGQREERARIARELHDTVTQDLVGIGMRLEAFERRVQNDRAARAELERLRKLSRGALADARGLVNENRPRQLEQHGSFIAALESLGGGAFATPRVEVTVDEEVVLDPEHEAVLFRVAQEAYSNARKHSGASVVTITVSAARSKVLLDIVDDGIGFDLDSSRAHGGFGLESMAARVEAARGKLCIDSTRGEGTSVQVALPIM